MSTIALIITMQVYIIHQQPSCFLMCYISVIFMFMYGFIKEGLAWITCSLRMHSGNLSCQIYTRVDVYKYFFLSILALRTFQVFRLTEKRDLLVKLFRILMLSAYV